MSAAPRPQPGHTPAPATRGGLRYGAVAVGVLGIAVLAYGVLRGPAYPPMPPGSELAVLPAGPVPRSVAREDRVSVLLVGDTHFGESYFAGSANADFLQRHGYDYPLARLVPLLRSADVVVANLETPLTHQVDSPLAGQKSYVHRGDPDKTPAALTAANIRVVSLANNHSMDFGVSGLTDTLRALAARDVHAFGAGATVAEAARPYRHDLVVGGQSLRLALVGIFERRRTYLSQGAYAGVDSPGVYGPDLETITRQIRALHEMDRSLWIIVFAHWGSNYEPRSEEQQRWAHALVDAGAQLVVGHGAHLLQQLESYQGRWILYGLGNFVFLSPGRYGARSVAPYSLAARLDVMARPDGLGLELSLFFIASDNRSTGYQPHLLSGTEFAEASRLLLRGDRSGEPARPELQRAAQRRDDAIGRQLVVSLGTVSSG